MYGLLLVDEYDTPYNTAHVITDQALWDWLKAPVDFQGKSSVVVPLPAGYTTEEGETEWGVTIGSCENDKAQALSSIAESHPEAVKALEFETDAFDDEEAGDGGDQWLEDARAALAKIPVKDTYEGLWY